MPASLPFAFTSPHASGVGPQRASSARRALAAWPHLAPAMLFVFLLAAFLPAAVAQPWNRFRGPNGEGVSATIFPAQIGDQSIAWRTDLPGGGHSSPAAMNGRAFLLSANAETAERLVIAVDLNDGAILWTKAYPSQPHHLHTRSSYASCTPAVDEKHVYAAWSSPDKTTLVALDHDGQEVWNRDLGPWVSQHGFGSSPMLYKNLVILHNSQQAEQLPPGQQPGKSEMIAVDRDSGKTVWATPLETVRVCYSVPCVLADENGKDQLICCSTSEGVFALDPTDGSLLWTTPSAFTMRTVSSPVLAGGLLFGSAGSGGGGNHVVAVRPGPKPEIVYTVKRQAPYVPTPVAKDGLIYLWYDKGVVVCLDAQTGKEHSRERVDGGYSGSPIIAGDKLYCISEEGELVALATGTTFRELARTPLGAPSRATPAVADGLLLLRTEKQLIAVKSQGA